VQYIWTGDTIPSDECSILIGNHAAGIDFVSGIVIAARASKIGCGRMMTMMKQSLLYVPAIGWTHYLQGSLFLNRNWEKDQKAIIQKLSEVSTVYPRPWWVGIYPEGTRITPKKKAESLQFAAERGLPQLHNILLPRTKGFTFLVSSLRSSLDSIVDCTCAYLHSDLLPHHPFVHGRFLTLAVSILLRRFDISEVPEKEKEQGEWLMKMFKEKDQLLQEWKDKGKFPGKVKKEQVEKRKNDLRLIFLGWATAVSVVLSLWNESWTLLGVMMGMNAWTLAHTFLMAKF